jgi:hypothetical protein
MTELEQKLEFAKHFRLNKDALPIIQAILPKDADAVTVLNAKAQWPFDPIVVAEIERLNNIPPTKEQIAFELHTKANRKDVLPEDQAKFYKLLIDLLNPGASSGKAGTKGADKLAELKAMLDET